MASYFPISSNIYIPFFNLIVLLNHLFGLCFFLPVPSRTHFSLRFSRSIEKQLMDGAFLPPRNIKEHKQEQLTCCAHLMRVPQQPKPFRFSIDSPSMRPSLLEIISALLVLEFHSDLMALIRSDPHHIWKKCSGRKLQCYRWPSPPRHDWNLENSLKALRLHLLHLLRFAEKVEKELYRSDHSSGSHPAIEATTQTKTQERHDKSVATHLYVTSTLPLWSPKNFSLNGFQ